MSDLHLGAHTGRDVLRRPEVRRALIDELSSIDRLILLGDVIELRHGPLRAALEVAKPVLSDLGHGLGRGKEVVIVPGNHDHYLLAAWLERQRSDGLPAPLGLQSRVDWRGGEPLATIAQALEPARLEVAYPGLWLRPDVYATHGHYADRHTTVPMFERLGAGAMTRVVRDPPGGPCRAEDYEAILAPIYAWLHAVAQNGGPELARSSHGASAQAWRTLVGRAPRSRWQRIRRRGLALAFPALIAALNRTSLGPLRADLSRSELRRAGLTAFAEVVGRLGVDAPHVIFGHTHRAGPLPTDVHEEWRASAGPLMTNAGCWVHEPGFLGSRPQESPYRAGFCVLVDGDDPPRLRNLLDAT